MSISIPETVFSDSENDLVVWCTITDRGDFTDLDLVDKIILGEARERIPNGKFCIEDRRNPNKILAGIDVYRCVFSR